MPDALGQSFATAGRDGRSTMPCSPDRHSSLSRVNRHGQFQSTEEPGPEVA